MSGNVRCWLSLVVLLWCSVVGCEDREPERQSVPARATEAPPPAEQPKRQETEGFLEALPYCEVRHRGLSIDTGSDWSNAHRSFGMGPFDDVRPVQRAGHTSGAVHSSRVSYDFWLTRNVKGLQLAARVQGERARGLGVYVDDKRVGDVRLGHGESKVVHFGPIARELSEGRHRVLMRFSRARGSAKEPLALLDWIRVYLPDNSAEAYAPPTRGNVVQDVELSGLPRRSITLQSPASVRCAVFPSRGSRVLVDVGYWGEGEGTAQVRAQLKDGSSVALAERRVHGGEEAEWTSLDLSLDAFESKLAVLEFSALEGSATGRVAFGEPKLAREVNEPEPVHAKNVVVIVAAGLARELIPPWGSREGFSELFSLTGQSALFDGYRVDTTVVTGVVATLLTGLPKEQHQVTDTSSRIAARAPLISETIRKVGGRSAFFTNVPYSFDAFGFDRGWNEFLQVSPVKDLPATEPLLRAKQWLARELEADEERKRLLVVHVRGGHPPWDLTNDEVNLLPPTDYSGILEPRRGAILLRQVRDRARASSRKLGPRDWQRLVALQLAALRKQDRAIGSLIRMLVEKEEWDDTLFLFLGDVARGDAPGVPFDPIGNLEEDRTSPPLFVKFPKGEYRGTKPLQLVRTLDVAQLIYEALGLETPHAGRRIQLTSLAAGLLPLQAQGLLAQSPYGYSYYLDRWRLSGTPGRVPELCDLEVDPACHHDLYDESPFHVHWLWRATLRELDRRRGEASDTSSDTADISEDVRAALGVFGM